MNLIANTGIQYYTVPLETNLDDDFKMYFHEWSDVNNKLKLELAHFFSGGNVWVKKHDLWELGYTLDGEVGHYAKGSFEACEWEDIRKDFNYNHKTPISINAENSHCFHESIDSINLDEFENVWFPFPFFLFNDNKSEFGSTNWCRFKLIPVEKNGQLRKYSLLMAFDTKSLFKSEGFKGENLSETPVFTTDFDILKVYALCNDEYGLFDYCSEEWVDKYLLEHFHHVNSIDDCPGNPKFRYLTRYIYFIRYIRVLSILPEITLYTNRNVVHSNVDLVIDIGNSRTCAVLFDDSDFTRTSPLELQNFTEPVSNGQLNKCCDSFDMRLAFREADFGGKFGIANSRQFIYPSMIRLGKEANQLISKSVNVNDENRKTSTFSSPKRFLWDTKPQKQEWEFVLLKGEKTVKEFYIEGISEQLNVDGSLNLNGDGGALKRYSRRALMTLAFLEILSQAQMQINSYEQRRQWGNESMPRKIGRIIVTCPTAMSIAEQISLRQCAKDAATMLNRFFTGTPDEVQVIPSATELAAGIAGKERTEWIYDEATAAQFVFLYAEIQERYRKNVKVYFDIYGKVRSDLANYDKKSLTIGSVDIGAGTSDVMIAAYKYDDSAGRCTLTPVPLFWESFYKAGDDLLKELIRQFVIEGKYSPIGKALRAADKNPVDLMQTFLGTDNGVPAPDRQLRRDFNLQISVPIVSYYLELLRRDQKNNKTLSYIDIFGKDQLPAGLLAHFDRHFGLEFSSLEWQYDREAVVTVIERIFDSLIGKISLLFAHYACDIVLLSGRPTSLKPLVDLFLKYYAISPNHLKSMNDYRVGRWYPQDTRHEFIDGNGKFINPKSIVTTGAMIAQVAENGGLQGFSLNLQELKKKLLPTTNFFGILNEQLRYGTTIISPTNNRATVEVPALPFRIGVRQMDIEGYPSRPFYMLDFNSYRIEEHVKERLGDTNDKNAVQQSVNAIKANILQNMPLKIIVSRDMKKNIEGLHIDSIVNSAGVMQNINFFDFQIQSMSEVENFWLDSGIFLLNINNQHN
jgi:hypothetical protein